MRHIQTTTKPLAGVAYATDAEIRLGLERWQDKLEWAHWIRHKPEPPKARVRIAGATIADRKEHVHIIAKWKAGVPSDTIESLIMRDDGTRAIQARGACNSLEDWLLYALHHPDYLEAKGMVRKHTYSWEDLKTTNPNELQRQAEDALEHLDKLTAKIRRRREVQKMGADLEIPWQVVLDRCRNLSEELVAWRYRDSERMKRAGKPTQAELDLENSKKEA